jgi:hypothetical protein
MIKAGLNVSSIEKQANPTMAGSTSSQTATINYILIESRAFIEPTSDSSG